ncbi:hypothetical protein NFI96_005302 [Prochilodus magdalenae]|nr:hypothetical protein NFI96_005302 [Prochilodus magdalenae]
MDLAPVSIILCLLAVCVCADKAKSCAEVRHFYSGKGFTLNGVPNSEISDGTVIEHAAAFAFQNVLAVSARIHVSVNFENPETCRGYHRVESNANVSTYRKEDEQQ